MSNFSKDIKEEVSDVKEEVNRVSFAYELLKEQRKQNKRLFVALIVVLVMWFCTATYLAYILTDIGTITDTIDIDNVDSIDNSNIKNGDDIWEKLD